jgi:hypothetical protein
MKVGDLIKLNLEGDGILVTPSHQRHGQLGVITEVTHNRGPNRRISGRPESDWIYRVLLMTAEEFWYDTEELEVMNESG